MIETQEEKINEEVNSSRQPIDEGWKKYNKRMDDMIDDVLIESEMEAEKKIRSKNSRLFTISIIGITLLVVTFIKVQQYSSTPHVRFDKKPLIEETTFIKSKTQPHNSQISQLVNATTTPMSRVTTASEKSKNIASRVNKSSQPKNIRIGKPFKPVSVKQIISGSDGKYFVQLGAFSIKENAEKLANKIKSKGFNAVISTSENRTYTVRVEGLETEKEAQKTRQELAAQGFRNSFIR